MRSNRIPKTGELPQLTRLKQLPLEQREQIVEWKATLTGEQVREKIGAEFGIKLSQDSQLSKFLRWQRGQTSVGAFAEIMELAEEGLLKQMSPEEARAKVIKWVYAQSALLEDPALALEAVAKSQAEAKAKIDEQKLQIDQRKLALLEKKAQQADAAREVVHNSTLSPEEQRARLKEILA